MTVLIERPRGNGKTTMTKIINSILEQPLNHEGFIPKDQIYGTPPFKITIGEKVVPTHPINVLHGKTSDIISKIMEDVDYLITHSNGTDIFICAPVVKEEKHRLDVKHPHKCFGCKKDLGWVELFNRNSISFFDVFNYRRLKKLWKAPIVNFFCCICFRKEYILEEIIKKQNRLKKKAYRICEKFGFDFEFELEFKPL